MESSLLTNFVALGYDRTHGYVPTRPITSSTTVVAATPMADYGLYPAANVAAAMHNGAIALQNQAASRLTPVLEAFSTGTSVANAQGTATVVAGGPTSDLVPTGNTHAHLYAPPAAAPGGEAVRAHPGAPPDRAGALPVAAAQPGDGIPTPVIGGGAPAGALDFPGVGTAHPELRLVGGAVDPFPGLSTGAQPIVGGGPAAIPGVGMRPEGTIVPNAAIDVFSALGAGNGMPTLVPPGVVSGGGATTANPLALLTAALTGATATQFAAPAPAGGAFVLNNAPTEFSALGQPASTPVMLPLGMPGAAGIPGLAGTVPSTTAVVGADGVVRYVTAPAPAGTAPGTPAATTPGTPAAPARAPTGTPASANTGGTASDTDGDDGNAAETTTGGGAANTAATNGGSTNTDAGAATNRTRGTNTRSTSANRPAAPTNRPAAQPRKPVPKKPVPGKTKTITITAGDTLSKLAAQHKTTVAKLMALNGIKDANKIVAGKPLKVPA